MLKAVKKKKKNFLYGDMESDSKLVTLNGFNIESFFVRRMTERHVWRSMSEVLSRLEPSKIQYARQSVLIHTL